MQKNPFVKPRLFCPGPTPVPLEISAAALDTNIYHRTESFRSTLLDCRKLLQPFFGCSDMPLILTSSGTGALESAMVNLTNVSDKIIVINAGKFGERWEKLGKAFQCNVITYLLPWGSSPNIEEFKNLLSKNPDCKAVFFQANETSTGVALPVKELAAAARSVSSALICVDAVSALVAHEISMDSWGIDAVVAGSQKGFGIPPGLSFIGLSKRAWAQISDRPKFYFDLSKEKAGQDKGETAWTPATTLISSLKLALEKLASVGPADCDRYHKLMATACRNAASAMGLELFPRSHLSQALTAVTLPANIDGSLLIKLCREKYGAIFAGGQDHLKGKIVRIAHLGLVDQLDLIGAIAAFEMGMKHLGHQHIFGCGVSAAMETLLDK